MLLSRGGPAAGREIIFGSRTLMASPFQFFRKHTAVMMVVVIGLSMAAFILLDPLMQLAQNPGQIQQLSVFLLPLLGGILAWTIKAASGRAMEYALWGAVAGAVVAAGWRITPELVSYAVLIGGLGVAAFGFWNIAASHDSTGAARSWSSRRTDLTEVGLRRGKGLMVNAAGTAVVTGCLFGVVAGIVGHSVGRQSAPAIIDGQPISMNQIDRLKQRRQLATSFLASLASAVDQQSGFRAQNHFTIGPRFGQPLSIEQDVVLGELFHREADRLGISVDDKTVKAYIEQFTAGREDKIRYRNQANQINRMLTDPTNPNRFQNTALFRSEFDRLTTLADSISDGNRLGGDLYRRTLRRIGATQAEAFDALREEIRIRTVIDILGPTLALRPEQEAMFGSSTTLPFAPAEAWQQLRRQQVKQTLDVAMLPVEAFLDDTEPGGGAVSQAFNDGTNGVLHKHNLPNRIEEGSPGFWQARRVNVGVFTIDFNEFEARVEDSNPVTRQQVTDYYNTHRETEFRNRNYRELPDDADDKKTDDKKTDDKKTDDKKTDDKKTDDKKADDKKADKPETKEPPLLDLDEVDPPPPPTPQRIEPKYIALETVREQIRRGLLTWRTEKLIRQAIKVTEDGPADSENLMQLIEAVRRPAIGSLDGEDSAQNRIAQCRTIQTRVTGLEARLKQLGEAARIPYRSTGVVSVAEIHQRSESTESEIDAAEFFRGLTVEQQIKSNANPFAFTPGQSVISEILSRETSAVYSLQMLIPGESTLYSLTEPPTNVTRNSGWSMQPDAKYFLWVVLEEIPGHTPTLLDFEWTGDETLEEVEQEVGYEVLVAPPGADDSLTVSEWFEILSPDGKPVRSRHLEVKQVTRDGKTTYTAIEYVGDTKLEDVVKESIRMRLAAARAKAFANETLKKLIEDAGKDTPLAEVLVDLTNSGQKLDPQQDIPGVELELKYQSIQTAVTAPFSWQAGSPPTAASTGIPEPVQMGLSPIPELPVPSGGQGAGTEFMQTFCETLAVGEVGVALSYDHTAVYIGRVTSRDTLEPKEFDAGIDSLLSNRSFQSQRGRATGNFLRAWLAEFQKRHGWNGEVLGVRP